MGFPEQGRVWTLIVAFRGSGAGLIIPSPIWSSKGPLCPFYHASGPKPYVWGGLTGLAPPGSREPPQMQDVLGTVTRAWKRPYLGCGFIVLVCNHFDPGVLQYGRVLGLGPGDRQQDGLRERPLLKAAMTLILRPTDLRGQPASLLLTQSSVINSQPFGEKRRHPATKNANQETQQEAPRRSADHLGSTLLDAGLSFFSHF